MKLNQKLADGGCGGAGQRGCDDGPSAEDIISMCDGDNSGGCTRDELNDMLDSMGAPADIKASINQMFNSTDVDGDSQVTASEI